MKYRKLGKSNTDISVLGLGTWVFGGQWWGHADEKACIRTIHSALDAGINLVDTAPIYGNGQSERIIGKAIADRRDKVFLATKCGLKINGSSVEHNLKPDSIKAEVEQSLKNLQVDTIDLYQCHWPDENTPLGETISALESLVVAGKIKYIGLSNYSIADMKSRKLLLVSQYTISTMAMIVIPANYAALISQLIILQNKPGT